MLTGVINNIRVDNKPWMCKVSMSLLALLPILAWYKIPFPLGLGSALVLFFSLVVIVIKNFKINALPISFWVLFIYVCFMWMYNNDFAFWSLLPPGGWIFFLFSLAILSGVLTFNLHMLKKYMKYIVLVSAVLFWVQFLIVLITGEQKICFVPNLTGSFTYENMSYSELVSHQLNNLRPSSIFLEPSYMAYYYVSYLALIWFSENIKRKWLTKEIIFIILTLLALQSGSGIVGLIILFIVKILSILRSKNTAQRILIILLCLPLFAGGSYIYLKSDIGEDMFSRTKEFSTQGTSGYTRVVGGYIIFQQLNFNEQIFGIPDARERFGIERTDGSNIFYINGVQTILISLGLVGALLYLFFYMSLFNKTCLTARICIIVLLVMGLLESNYLNPYMMMLTIIPCADYYYNMNKQ